MKTETTQITRSGVTHTLYRRRRLLLAATYSLTSSLIAPTLYAAHCSMPKNGTQTGTCWYKSALPFIGDRCVRIKPSERTLATLTRAEKPS